MNRSWVSRFRLVDKGMSTEPKPGEVFEAGSIQIGCTSGGSLDMYVHKHRDTGDVGFKLTAWGKADEKGSRKGTGGELGVDEAYRLRDWLVLHLGGAR